MKKDKIINKQQNMIAKEKDNFAMIIKYLIDSYYYDCHRKITIEKIQTSMNIKDSKIVEVFIKYLRDKKYIKGKKAFIITFEGFLFLEELRMKYNEYENNFTNMIIGMGALLLTTYCAMFSNNITMQIIFTIITICGVFYFLEEILKKKYK